MKFNEIQTNKRNSMEFYCDDGKNSNVFCHFTNEWIEKRFAIAQLHGVPCTTIHFTQFSGKFLSELFRFEFEFSKQ